MELYRETADFILKFKMKLSVLMLKLF